MNKNVCIIHFNTPTLTERLVESINKHVQDAIIYIFDNSDKKPFTKEYDNVKIFDNTKGQIINFDKWLKKYPRRTLSGGKANKWGSAKHAYSVEKCMELIGEPFVLLDSDVLIRRNFSNLYVDGVAYVGEVVNQPRSKIKRVLPFICFINTEKCLKNKIHYFDERYMHGLRVGTSGDCYDTGAALYLLTEKAKAPKKQIKVADYVVHYGSGSWVGASVKMKKKPHISEKEWLAKYNNLWNVDEINGVTATTFGDFFDHIYCLHNLQGVDRLTTLKNEFRRVGIDEEAPYFSWKYSFPSTILDCLFDDKRLNMSVQLRSTSRKSLKNRAIQHYEVIKEAYGLGYDRILIMEDNIRFHNDLGYIQKMLENLPEADVILFDKMVRSFPGESQKYKEYVKGLDAETLYGNNDNLFFIFASCYVLNRNGMSHIIERQEKELLPPDTPFNDTAITTYFAVTNLAIQDPKLMEVKTESYDKIGLDTTKYGGAKMEPVKKTTIVQKSAVGFKTKHSPISVVPKKVEVRPKVSTKKTVVEKAKHVHTRTIYAGPAKHYNKLYDIL